MISYLMLLCCEDNQSIVGMDEFMASRMCVCKFFKIQELILYNFICLGQSMANLAGAS